MSLVFAAIAPHGSDIVPQVADDPAVMAQTRAAMQELGRRCAAARPETVVVLDPHGLMVSGAISLGATATAFGILGDPSGRHIQAGFECDLELAAAIEADSDRQSLPIARLVGDKRKGEAILPLEWGALVPLWFTAHPLTPRPRIVVLAPDRALSRETLVRAGLAIAWAAERTGRRVALVASCDQGHAHHPGGPYGFDPASAEHDAEMIVAIAEDDLERILDWEESFLEEAKVDAYWQTIMLMGALGHTPMKPELLSYEAPTYFGMIVAAFAP